eukprot:scaffold161955_cov24-Prasinocladus_malaysianus.AAC.1
MVAIDSENQIVEDCMKAFNNPNILLGEGKLYRGGQCGCEGPPRGQAPAAQAEVRRPQPEDLPLGERKQRDLRRVPVSQAPKGGWGGPAGSYMARSNECTTMSFSI